MISEVAYCNQCKSTITAKSRSICVLCNGTAPITKELPSTAVTKPKHYNEGKIEAWDYILDSLGVEGFKYYCEGNVKKYLHRWRYKGKPKEDLEKAKAYLERLIELS